MKALVIACGILLASSACTAQAGSPPAPTTEPSADLPRAADPGGRVPPLGPVFVIIGENTSRSRVTPRHAPYLTGVIQPRAAWLLNYYGLADGSLANYVGMTSGQFTPCEVSDGPPAECHQDVDNLFSQLSDAGLPWREW